jgi:anti-anti-sigma factor
VQARWLHSRREAGMDIKVRSFEANYIIDVAGEIDLYNAFLLKDTVKTMIEKKISVLILNLRKVTYIDSSGIGALLSINAMLAPVGVQFRIVRVPPSVMRVMELTRLIGFLPVENTEIEALEEIWNAKTSEGKEAQISGRKETQRAILSLRGSWVSARKGSVWENVRHAIDQSKTLTVKTFTYLPGERVHIDKILATFLKAVDMAPLGNNLSYCIHELAGNAKRANTKRLYFAEKKLNILDGRDYALGMQGFKQEAVEKFDNYLVRLRESGLYVKFQFRKISTGLRICIRNNAILTPIEKSRIEEKLAIAKSFSNLADAYARTEDGVEGAGLGIVMMLFMLRNLGFDQDVFDIRTSGAETIATLTLTRPASTPASETETAASV